MKSERWHQVKQVLHAALESGPEQRAAFVAEACAGDESLRREVESLLVSHDEARSIFEMPAPAIAGELLRDRLPDSAVGERIGPYEVVSEIGRGGMGAVYLAARADEQYQNRVAIKLIKRGMDTDFILRRFRHERQILASLDHPNIGRLLDGGATDDGLPYLVMEYIEGTRIDEYCDTHKLSIPERLKLFRTACAAVHYAHQNLVVHRDIKPSNILVTEAGIPKLLDFGIAKLLNPELSAETVEQTASVLRLMTPEYASPEQVRGESITTASDIYSLGVLLYELLSGHRPYQIKSRVPAEIERVISEQEPQKPSAAVIRDAELPATGGTGPITLTPETVSRARETQPDKLSRMLSGDLDNIVAKALRKEPTRRYPSVEQFSEDVRRYMENLPVTARKDTFTYRAEKFVQRHKAGAIAAGLILLTLVGGVMATVWQARVARVERARAEQRFNDVRKLANSFMFEFHDAIVNLPGSTPARELVVKRALEYIDGLAQEAGDDPTLQRELATAYQKVGEVQDRWDSPSLGDTAGALESHRKALTIREALVASGVATREDRRDQAVSYSRIGDALWARNDSSGQLESYRKGVAIDEALVADDPADKQALRNLATDYYNIGYALFETGDLSGALETFRKERVTVESLAAADPTNLGIKLDVARSHTNIGYVLDATRDFDGALESHRKAAVICEELIAVDPSNLKARGALVTSYFRIGGAMKRAGNLTESLANYRKSLALAEALLAADQSNAQAHRTVALVLNGVGEALTRIGDLDGAFKSFDRARAISEARSAANPTNMDFRTRVVVSYYNLCLVKAQLGDGQASLENCRRARSLAEEMVAADSKTTMLRGILAFAYYNSGLAHETLVSTRAAAQQRLEHWREARSWYQRSLDAHLELRNRGAFTHPEYGSPEESSRRIAGCDEALAKLVGSGVATSGR